MHRLAPLLLLCTGCLRAPSAITEPPRLTVAEIAAHVPPKVTDRDGWATDVRAALDAQKKPADLDTVCQVLAIIEQESGFQADPAVPGLPKLIKSELKKRVEKLGPVGDAALEDLLNAKAPGSKKTFEARLDALKTERDLDLLFRDILAYYRERFPAPYKALDLFGPLFGADPDDFNPVTTVGSMQVAVQFAEKKAKSEGREADGIRDELYTRPGGVYFGAARLLDHEAAYAQPLYRFADYNAGVYASRNAALQEQVAALVDVELVLDGDLLAYDKHGEPLDRETKTLSAILLFARSYAPELSERRVRNDVRLEKTAKLEGTETWRAIKRVYAQRKKVDPPYARVPEVTLKSPKLSGDRSTAWFAKSVDGRYRRCLER